MLRVGGGDVVLDQDRDALERAPLVRLIAVKRRGNRRYYQHHEVLLIRRIRELLYEQGFTISGARQHLRAEIKSDKSQPAIPFPTQAAPEIQHIRQGLREILDLLSARRTG